MPPRTASETTPLRPLTKVLDPREEDAHVDRRLAILPPDPQAWDPFILLGYDAFSTTGFDWHPHAGFQAVTFVLDGDLEHMDDQGNQEVLHGGELSYTVIGRGIRHREMPVEERPIEGLQLWFNLPAALQEVAPRYETVRRADWAITRPDGCEVRVALGRFAGATGPVDPIWPAIVADLRLGGTVRSELPDDHAGCVYVHEGVAQVNGTAVRAGQAAWFDVGTGGLHIEGDAARALVYAGRRIGERVTLDMANGAVHNQPNAGPGTQHA